MQPRVLRLGLLQDGDFGVGVFPERQNLFVSPAQSRSAKLFCSHSLGKRDNDSGASRLPDNTSHDERDAAPPRRTRFVFLLNHDITT